MTADGRRYSALPVALRYRSTADSTCSCHRDAVAYAPLDDATLRRGDLIMTPAGFVMFRGEEGTKHRPGDFAALAKASLPPTMRGDLQAMERVSLASDHPTLRQWLASQSDAGPRRAQAPAPDRARRRARDQRRRQDSPAGLARGRSGLSAQRGIAL